MKRLTALTMITLTMTSMLPLTANAAGYRYTTCPGGNRPAVITGNCNLENLIETLQRCGADGSSADWWNLLNGGTAGGTNNEDLSGSGADSDANSDTDNNTDNNTGANDSTDPAARTYAQQVVDLVNAEREKAGLAPLTVDADVEKAAAVRAGEIQTVFDHTRPNGSSFYTALTAQGVDYRSAGENIAWGQKTPEEVMTAWMNSAGHRANILNANYTHIGVGSVKNSAGNQYWVQLFTN